MIILNPIRRPHDSGLFEAWHSPVQRLLDLFGQAAREAVRVYQVYRRRQKKHL